MLKSILSVTHLYLKTSVQSIVTFFSLQYQLHDIKYKIGKSLFCYIYVFLSMTVCNRLVKIFNWPQRLWKIKTAIINKNFSPYMTEICDINMNHSGSTFSKFKNKIKTLFMKINRLRISSLSYKSEWFIFNVRFCYNIKPLN